MSTYRGSTWQKWDLHIHLPTTRLNNQFRPKGKQADWERYCTLLHESEVQAFGLTDYFNLNSYFEFRKQYAKFFPDDTSKTFFPNLEMRLDKFVNGKLQHVNVHVIFKPDLTEGEAETFAYNLKLAVSDSSGRRQRSLKDAEGWEKRDIEGAMVAMDDIATAINASFDDIEHHTDAAIIVASGRADGISPGGNNSPRNYNTIDEIDKRVDAIFSRARDSHHWLKRDRLDSGAPSTPKPTFGGCDAHSFDDLEKMLGTSGHDETRSWETTWIKADLSFDGLRQTLIEPEQRVKIQPLAPDAKPAMYVLDRIDFPGSSTFPASVHFNPNLNAIIGSRSSGKSALLSYLGHAIDANHVVSQQIETQGALEHQVGPAAGKTWSDVSSIERQAYWSTGESGEGRIIYVPQNSLYSLSGRPDEVSDKIQPILFREFTDLRNANERLERSLYTLSKDIDHTVDAWFEKSTAIDGASASLSELGGKESITSALTKLREEFSAEQQKLDIAPEEAETYAELRAELSRLEDLAETSEDEQVTAQRIVEEGTEHATSFHVDISIVPSISDLPPTLRELFTKHASETALNLQSELQNTYAEWQTISGIRSKRLRNEVREAAKSGAELIAKHEQAVAAEELSREISVHEGRLAAISKAQESLTKLQGERDDLELRLSGLIERREGALRDVEHTFSQTPRTFEGIEVFLEMGVQQAAIDVITSDMNTGAKSEYLVERQMDGKKIADIGRMQADPGSFLRELLENRVRLRKSADKVAVARRVMRTSKSVRYSGVMDGDRIGGFSPSTMTPGKQALFALTLILAESDAPWPLLIDQPEDDLDSRSISSTVVPYLLARKKERQIIMVTHDANLVVGADAEQVIIANRHGDDRPNRDSLEFDYRSGALENTVANKDVGDTLWSTGVRNHCCDILDGGEEAFEKRQNKYRIGAVVPSL